MRLWCVDRSRGDFDEAAAKLRAIAAHEQRDRVIDLWVATKGDLVNRKDCNGPVAASEGESGDSWIECSAVSGQGIERLQHEIERAISFRDAEETGSVVGTAARCSDSLRTAGQALAEAIRLTRSGEGHELVATELRTVAQCLGEVTGAVYTDDILDRVFSRFCIGK